MNARNHNPNRDHDRLHELIASACNAPLSPEGAAAIEQLLTDNPAAVDLYLDQCELHTDLRFVLRAQQLDERVAEQIVAESGEQPVGHAPRDENNPTESAREACPTPRSKKSWLDRASKRPTWPALAITVLIMSSVIGWMALAYLPERVAESGGGSDEQNVPEKAKAPEAVARLVYTVEAVWESDFVAIPKKTGKRRIRAGIDLAAGQKLHLLSGVAEFKFFGGGEVVLEGPAEFEIQTGVRGRLELGRLTARAPVLRAKGFSIDTPSAEVEDLGTEFGVNVDGRGDVEVAVFDGKVVTRPAAEGGVAMELVTKQTAMIAHGVAFAEIVDAQYQYVSRIRYPTKDATTTRLDVQAAYIDMIKSASPIGYWRLSQANATHVPNQIADHNHARRHFGVLGPEDPTRMDGASTYLEVDNEIGDTFSLELWFLMKRPSHRGEQSFLGSTLFTCEIPGFKNDFTLSVFNDRMAYWEGPTETDMRGKRNVVNGRWHHIVLVRQRGDENGVRIYVDGRLDARAATNDKILNENPQLLIGGMPSAKRYFNGWVDEVAVYDHAITDEEISAHYELIAKPKIEYFSDERSGF